MAAAISRYASSGDGLTHNYLADPEFVKIWEGDIAEGIHRNHTDKPYYFTTTKFHRPEELSSEITAGGFHNVQILGVEGPTFWLTDLDQRVRDPDKLANVMRVARALESEPSIIGASAHFIAVARK